MITDPHIPPTNRVDYACAVERPRRPAHSRSTIVVALVLAALSVTLVAANLIGA